MKSGWIKFVAILALGLYLGGPLFETVDRWDDFKGGTGDLVLSMTGAVSLLAAAVGFGIAKVRQLRTMGRRIFRRIEARAPLFGLHSPMPLTLPLDFHSPPIPLRI